MMKKLSKNQGNNKGEPKMPVITEPMELNIDSFKKIIKNIVMDLSSKDYKKIELEKTNGRVNIADLENIINEYGKTIIPLPDKAFEIANVYTIEKEKRIDIYVPLWTKEEGRSDLTLSITCYLKNNKPVIEMNDLEVL
jgi:hypothetical protein